MTYSFDEELLARAQAGDAAAFTALVRPHLDTVRRFAFSFSGNWAEADDLAQDALVKAYRSLSTFRAQSSLSTWLYAIARTTFIDSKRSRASKARAREDDLDTSIDSGEEAADELMARREDIELLWARIRVLEPRFRVPLVLYDIEGMSYEHIASIERVPVGTVRSRLSRARAKLLELLRPSEGSGNCWEESGTRASPHSSHPRRRIAP